MKPRAFLSLTISFVLTLMLGACSFAGDDAAAPHGAAAKTASSQPSQESSENSQESMKNTTATTKHVYSKSGYDITPYSKDKVQALAATLSKEAYDVTQRAGTEAAFCGNLLDNHKDGMYVCVVCGLPLFSSENKFNSGTGWPSFYKEFDPAHVVRHDDNSFGMVRTEIRCARCGAHLGHVFDDGPKPTGERHCLNSAALKFIEKGETVPAESQPVNTETAYFAGGCFWGVEYYFDMGNGVISAESGFMQGHVANPSYKQVCYDNTGHAESVKVVFDPSVITYRQLLEAFFKMIDPTTKDHQGPDYGDQYRSGIWTVNDEQAKDAKAYIAELEKSGRYGSKEIVTEVEPAKTFYPAEDYHQDYIVKTGRTCHVTNPWTDMAGTAHH